MPQLLAPLLNELSNDVIKIKIIFLKNFLFFKLISNLLLFPGPSGLDEEGSSPSLEQQQQKSSSSLKFPQSTQQPFSSVSPNIMINQQQQQPNLPSRQISLEEAKESQKFWTFSLEIIFSKIYFSDAGNCQFYKRTGTCNFGERCKFAHDDEHLTFGVQTAMLGASMPNRGLFKILRQYLNLNII